MKFRLRLLISRLRRTATLTVLRLTGLILAAVLAASVPTFVAGAMERVLHEQALAAQSEQAVVIGWSSADTEDHAAGVEALDRYLRDAIGNPQRLTATIPGGVQRYGEDGALQAGRRYLKLAVAPASGFTVATGRPPEPGKPEVVMPDQALTRSGYKVGDKLRVSLPDNRSATVIIVGTISLPADSPLAPLSASLDSALLTSPKYWRSLDAPAGDVTWAVGLADLHAADVPALVGRLEQLPLRVGQSLSGAEVVATPAVWLGDFARQMAATERFLLVLLTPVFALVAGFVLATANVVVDSRRTESAVLRSRGATPWQIIRFYLPESGLLACIASLGALALTMPLVRLMGLTAGFLRLVGRPPLPATLTWTTFLYGLAAALLAEGVALFPLVRAARLTVATIRQEAVTRSPVLEALRTVGEAALLGVVVYGTWRLHEATAMDDPLLLTLPALSLAAAGLVMLRLFEWGLALFDRVIRPWLAPAFYLAVSLLRHQSGRYRALSLMLVVTTGLGIYGAAFARTLDRDLVARSRYRVGADLTLRATWESEVLSLNPNGEPDQVVYSEPPFDLMKSLPGATGGARVQIRKGLAVSSGTRNLGKTDLMAITPQEFGQAARFAADLTPYAGQFLGALAGEERAAVISASLASRTGLKPGDQIRVKQSDAEAALTVAGIVSYWPGRLPDDGDFVVANLPYIQDALGLAPYSVWYRLEPSASLASIFGTLGERGVRLAAVEDSRTEIARGRRQPFRLGVYATLSAGFLVAVVVMALTYLLSVGLTLQARMKELGVLRAMGMTARQVALTLYLEQAVRVGVAVATGLGGGNLAAQLYVPALRQQPGEALLPLKLASVAGDRLSLALALFVTLVAGAAIMRAWLRRLQIQAVLRLGEDG